MAVRRNDVDLCKDPDAGPRAHGLGKLSCERPGSLAPYGGWTLARLPLEGSDIDLVGPTLSPARLQ